MSFNKLSRGEEKIARILRDNKIAFKVEYSFPDLLGLKNIPLRFDFAVFQKGKLYCCIDYDGAQHFKYVKHFHKTPMGFRKAKEWDRRKNAYCLKHNIPFLRIPYWDYDKLTLQTIFSTPEYLVKNKFHNDFLINGGEK